MLPTLDQIAQLPQTQRVMIPPAYLDEMGHMNIQYYIHIFDRAAWSLFALTGLTLAEMQRRQGGMFALKQFIQYLAEVHQGETVAIYSRFLAAAPKRVHFMHFMVNETRPALAATFEVLASYADLTQRRTALFPADTAAALAALIAQHEAVGWSAPVCGVLAP